MRGSRRPTAADWAGIRFMYDPHSVEHLVFPFLRSRWLGSTVTRHSAYAPVGTHDTTTKGRYVSMLKRFSETAASSNIAGEWVNKSDLIGQVTVITSADLRAATFPDPEKGRTQDAVFTLKFAEDIVNWGYAEAPVKAVSSSAMRNIKIAGNAAAEDWPCLVQWVELPPAKGMPNGTITFADPAPDQADLCRQVEQVMDGTLAPIFEGAYDENAAFDQDGNQFSAVPPSPVAEAAQTITTPGTTSRALPRKGVAAPASRPLAQRAPASQPRTTRA